MRQIFLFMTLVFGCCVSFAQTPEMIKGAIREALKGFTDTTVDEMYGGVSPDAFIPPNGNTDTLLMRGYNLKLVDQLNQSAYNNGAFIVEDKEYPAHTIEMQLNYSFFPDFKNTAVTITLEQAVSSSGRNVLLGAKEMQEYEALGFIEKEMYPIPGERSEKIWLAREPVAGDTIILTGYLTVYYPSVYETLVFENGDTARSKKLGEYTYTLVEIKHNTCTYKTHGPRFVQNPNQVMYLDSADRAFFSYSSVGLDALTYETAKKNGFHLSDSQMNDLIGKLDITNPVGTQVTRAKTGGSINKVVFYQVKNTGETKIPFRRIMGF